MNELEQKKKELLGGCHENSWTFEMLSEGFDAGVKNDCPFCTDKKITIKELKKKYTEHILDLVGFKKTKASKILGINPRLLREWTRLGKVICSKPIRSIDTGYKTITANQRDKFYNRSRW